MRPVSPASPGIAVLPLAFDDVLGQTAVPDGRTSMMIGGAVVAILVVLAVAGMLTIEPLFAAAADVFALACVDAVLTASVVGTAPTYLTVCPSARSRAGRE